MASNANITNNINDSNGENHKQNNKPSQNPSDDGVETKFKNSIEPNEMEKSDDEPIDNNDDSDSLDASLEFGDSDDDLIFGFDDDDEKEETPQEKAARKQQEELELFWKLMDMGFSRERTAEAVLIKGYTDVAAASEYLLSTGNQDAFSFENAARDDHKYYSKNFSPSRPNEFNKAISREANLLRSSLPEGIFVRGFEDRTDLYSVMMKGPKNTPYEDALFLFDIQLSRDYPQTAPKFHFISYSGSSMHRLNPNLYIEGKVCVSLLGTWAGQGVENWDPKNSNLFQVLVSIQGLILVSEPYFNEPGYERSKGTKQGTQDSGQYNQQVLIEVMKSVARQAERPPPLFHNEVREHFRETSQHFIRRLETWFELKIDEIEDQEDKGLFQSVKRKCTQNFGFGMGNLNKVVVPKEDKSIVDKSNEEKKLPTINTVLGATVAFLPPEFPLLPISDSFKTQIVVLMKKFQKAVKDFVEGDLKTL